MPVGWNWKNSMSSSGIPRRKSRPGPSPVSEWALDETLNIFPKPPLVKSTAFVRNTNQVLSHYQLVELAWGSAGSAERDQVKLYVGYLRRKLGTPTDSESPIETVRGFGYRYKSI